MWRSGYGRGPSRWRRAASQPQQGRRRPPPPPSHREQRGGSGRLPAQELPVASGRLMPQPAPELGGAGQQRGAPKPALTRGVRTLEQVHATATVINRQARRGWRRSTTAHQRPKRYRQGEWDEVQRQASDGRCRLRRAGQQPAEVEGWQAEASSASLTTDCAGAIQPSAATPVSW